MNHPNQESATLGPVNILKNYSFESTHLPYEKVLDSWLQRFPLNWVNLAVVESLHQGRYKVVSVEQILTLWQRRGKPSYHFNHDFERLVSNNLPQPLNPSTTKAVEPKIKSSPSFSRPRASQSTFSYQDWNPVPKVEPSPRKDVEWEEVDNNETATGSNASHTYSEEFTSQPDYEETQEESVLLTEESLAQNFPKIEPSLQNSSLGEEEPSRMDSEIQSTGDFSEPELIENIVDSSSEEFRQEATEIPSFSPVSPDSSVEFHLNPIHQFVPQTETSEFCAKLTAMAQVNV